MRKRSIVILFTLLSGVMHAFAQQFPDLQFEHITVKEGLSSNNVTGITEDKQGFIWVATVNGINRYDGYRFKQYYHSNTDSNSLVNNAIQTIFCDSKGRLWIGTEDGVSCMLVNENRFINYSTKRSQPYQLKNNNSVKIYEDAEGEIWFSNQLDYLFKVMPDYTLKETRLAIPAFYYFNLSLLGYDCIVRDNGGNEWAYKVDRIYRINKQSKQPVETIILPGLKNAQILRMMMDKSGRFLIATWSLGVFQYDPVTGIIENIKTIPARVYPEIIEWTYASKSWLATIEINAGLFLLDPATMASKKYGVAPGDPTTLQGNTFNSFFADRKHNLWIGSNSGINKIKAEQSIVNVIPVTDPGSNNYDLNKSGHVYGFIETDSSIWLSKRFVSTFEFDTSFRIKRCYRSLFPLSADQYTPSGHAYYFLRVKDDLYASTDSGLVLYDLKARTSKGFFPVKPSIYTNFRTLIMLDDTAMLIRSFDKGMFVFNVAEKKFTRYYPGTNAGEPGLAHKLNYLFKARNNEIYVASSSEGKNLFRYDRLKDRFVSVKAVNDETYSMQASDLYGMDEDKEGNLWITSSAGLFIYDPRQNRIIQQNNDNEQIGGLARICFDDYGNAWANGSSGIYCYLQSRKKWISFNTQDGLPGSDFTGTIIKKKNGDIVAGLEGAVALFHPKQLNEQAAGYPAVITEALADNHIIPFALLANADKRLVLKPGQASFSVDFALLNYVSPASSHYYYKLTPLMKEFRLNDNGHINFNGLSPGDYTLYVRGGDKAGNIFDKEDILRITIEPMWYQAAWFKILCLLAAVAIVYFFVRKRISRIRKEASFKQQIAETEMQALRAQMNPHFIFNSLNSIENFIMRNEKRQASDYLNKFSRLIRSILDSSRNELVPVAKDMEALQWYVDMEQLRFNHRFSYEVKIDPLLLSGDYRIPSLLIQPYVENAILHGLAHSEKTGLQLSVVAQLENEIIRYRITDNGIGRAAAAAYNKQNKPAHKSVGLQITAERIRQFNGNKNAPITFTDLFDVDGNPAGTTVELLIKPA